MKEIMKCNLWIVLVYFATLYAILPLAIWAFNPVLASAAQEAMDELDQIPLLPVFTIWASGTMYYWFDLKGY